jgi:hypothetical protein
MSAYETIATVEDHGQVHLAGLPFAPGTEVEVAIKPAHTGEQEVPGASDRAARLFAALDKARNASPIGALGREELYDRKVLR